MARLTKNTRSITTSVKIQVRQPHFELLDSVKLLDLAKLSRAAQAEIELGYLKTSCCHQLVRAIVKKGKVTEIRVEPPTKKDRLAVSSELKQVLRSVRRTMAARRPGGGRLPMPVTSFMAQAKPLTIKTIMCFEICFFGWCIQCCEHWGNPGEYICGRITIDTTRLPD